MNFLLTGVAGKCTSDPAFAGPGAGFDSIFVEAVSRLWHGFCRERERERERETQA
jgi:hypothetical protein